MFGIQSINPMVAGSHGVFQVSDSCCRCGVTSSHLPPAPLAPRESLGVWRLRTDAGQREHEGEICCPGPQPVWPHFSHVMWVWAQQGGRANFADGCGRCGRRKKNRACEYIMVFAYKVIIVVIFSYLRIYCCLSHPLKPSP